MKRRCSWITTLSLVAALLPACSGLRFVIEAGPLDDGLVQTVVLEDPGTTFGAASVALIDVTGVIADERRSWILSDGENPVGRFGESLRAAADDDRIRALIVRINSPGGTVTASDVMYRELVHFRSETGKPVVVLMGDVAASGGFYLSCAADEVIAHPTTVTGSIGVIMQFLSVREGLLRLGIRPETITSGSNKAAGSPFEHLTDEQRALFQEIVDEFFGRFRSVVAAARPGMAPDALRLVGDGRIVTGARAFELGLVDGVGDLRDAFASAKRRAGLTRARLVKYHRRNHHVGSAYAASPATVPLLQVNLGEATPGLAPRFLYLWDPAAWR